MYESITFLKSLEHTNPHRPRFEIGTGMDTPLAITHHGQCLSVPIAEILEFARRWREDFEEQRARRIAEGVHGLQLYPYPLYSTRLTDPDCADVERWYATTVDSIRTNCVRNTRHLSKRVRFAR